MKKKLLFLILILISPFLKSFNFQVKEFLYCTACEFFQLLNEIVLITGSPDQVRGRHGWDDFSTNPRLQKIKKDFLWHLTIPEVGLVSNKKILDDEPKDVGREILLWDLAEKKGSNIKIAILDSEIDYLNKEAGSPAHRQFFLSECCQNVPKNNTDAKILNFDPDGQSMNNRPTCAMKKNKKNHGQVTYEIIKQLAPMCEIIIIPIIDKNGFTSKKNLYIGLQKALDVKVDIVHLGLKYNHEKNLDCALDAQINIILKNFPYVVAAAGNDGKSLKELAYPAAQKSIFFSVGAFERKNNSYPICDFSQGSLPYGLPYEDDKISTLPNFVFPGSKILCPVFDNETQDYLYINFSGTSMACAMMTGFLALVLAEFKNNFTKNQIQEVILKSSKKMEVSWEEKVNFGMIQMREAVVKFIILKDLKYKKVLKKNKKNFVKTLSFVNKFFVENVDFFINSDGIEGRDKSNVKKTNPYANCDFHKKIDRDLYILVQDSIYALKENIWEKKYN